MHLGSIIEKKSFEKRLAITPESAKKYISLGFKLSLQENYGTHLGFDDELYKILGVNFVNNEKDIISKADIIIQLGILDDEKDCVNYLASFHVITKSDWVSCRKILIEKYPNSNIPKLIDRTKEN